MTATAYSEPNLSVDQFELSSARTLQDIHNVSASILRREQIDHAVLLYMPSPAHALALPLLPIKPELQAPHSRAIASHVHPAVDYERPISSPKALSEIETSAKEEAALAELMTAFQKAGMRQVYELPLTSCRPVRFIFEIARIGQPISDIELSEIQSIASVIPDKLPDFLVNPPNDTFMEVDMSVR